MPTIDRPVAVFGGVIFLVVVAIILVLYIFIGERTDFSTINNYSDCVAAGYPVSKSLPPKCNVPDGREFVSVDGSAADFTGRMVCLPHKNTDGPQTLECAYGMQADNGNYYGLADERGVMVFQVNIGDRVRAKGTLSNPGKSNYDIVGTIALQSLTKI